MILENDAANYTVKASGPACLELIIPDNCAGLRLDQALARLLPEFSRNRLASWVRRNLVSVDGQSARPRQKVWGGENIRVAPEEDPRELAHLPEAIPIDIVYEDETLLVINKPAGMVVHPGAGHWHGTLLNALLQHVPALKRLPRAGIVHRLDKETSGLLAIAKTVTAQTELVRQLQARSVTREYLAVTQGRVSRDGKIDAPIGRHPLKRTRMAVVARGKPAITHYHVVERFAHASLLRCRLETGRTHQIRVHLNSIGHPLVGDPVYGMKPADAGSADMRFARQALHAEKLALIHPVSGQIMAWHAKLPADMRELIARLRQTS